MCPQYVRHPFHVLAWYRWGIDGVYTRQADNVVSDCPLRDLKRCCQLADSYMPSGAQLFHNHMPAPSRQHAALHLLGFRPGMSISPKAAISLPLLSKFSQLFSDNYFYRSARLSNTTDEGCRPPCLDRVASYEKCAHSIFLLSRWNAFFLCH